MPLPKYMPTVVGYFLWEGRTIWPLKSGSLFSEGSGGSAGKWAKCTKVWSEASRGHLLAEAKQVWVLTPTWVGDHVKATYMLPWNEIMCECPCSKLLCS